MPAQSRPPLGHEPLQTSSVPQMRSAPSHYLSSLDFHSPYRQMNSFSFGKPVSPSGAHPPAHRHSRSHSRNSSVSLPMSLSTPISLTTNDSPPHSPTRNSITGGKRNSHHRRLSSVSTRRESADLMGVSLPSIPLSSSEDNINLGDKDSIRRRALLALEGKESGSNFSVEIPELDAPDVPKRSFDFRTYDQFLPLASFVKMRFSFQAVLPPWHGSWIRWRAQQHDGQQA